LLACSGDENDVFSPQELGRTNHAWNAVLLNGAWYLVDATWDAGRDTGGQWVRDFVTDWFLCEPEAMIMRHLQENPIWQLKYPVTTAEEFA